MAVPVPAMLAENVIGALGSWIWYVCPADCVPGFVSAPRNMGTVVGGVT